MFQPVQSGSIYAGGSQTKCMGKTALTVKAGVAYGHQSDICGTGDTKCSDNVFMELRTRQAPVPQERSIMPVRPIREAFSEREASVMGWLFLVLT